MTLIRTLCLFIILLISSYGSYAQNEYTTWYFGKGLGLDFRSGMANPLNAPAHASSRYITSSSVISDKNTGQLLFYTNGTSVFNRYHQEMPNGNLGTQYFQNILIVPDPGDTMLYFVFYTQNNALSYSKVDMRLSGASGAVTQKNIPLFAPVDNRFAVVKQLYNGGYWLITHLPNSNNFQSYRITKEGIQPTPVLSTTSETVHWPVSQTFYNEIVTSVSGEQFVVMNNDASSPNGKYILLFDFDKKCGTVSLKKTITSHFFVYDVALDVSAKFLYVIVSWGGGNRNIIQHDLSKPGDVDGLSGPPLIQGNEPMSRMKLAPDNSIYVTKQELIGNGYSPSRYIDVILKPSVEGPGCIYREKFFNLSPGNQCFNDPCYLTDRFPNMIMDRTKTQPRLFEEPQLSVSNFCQGETTAFNMTPVDLYADSMHWDFGDSTSASSPSANHVYQKTGTYDATFNWYLCGQRYTLHREVKIGSVPAAFLGEDSTVCYGHEVSLSPPLMAESYLWSTGDTTFSVRISSPGSYAVEVRNGNCTATDTVTIDFYDRLWTKLGEEYFICDRDQELVRLDAGPGYTQYKWTPTGDTAQWIIVGDLGNYFVVVKDFRGCDGNDGTIVKRICPVELFFPTAFTPNGDGINDTYLPVGNSVVSFSMNIYNRWGQSVFRSDDLSHGWNGKSEDLHAPDGVYVYTAYYTGYINKILRRFGVTGEFTLIR
ncbi:MAG: gliding motility-associated C-terminal domain-containing protein [Bacteroidia bacterium]|jgi:gliding motility-associated-like protein